MTRIPDPTRRQTLCQLGATLGAGLVGLGAGPAHAEPPPETTTVRLLFDPQIPILCWAPQYLAEEFLRLEGFTDIRYAGFEGATSDSQVLIEGRVDFSAGLGSDYIVAIDKGAPVTLLGGLHAGCVELFAGDRVASIRDIAGKRFVATGPWGPEHIFLSSVAAFVGLDPARDVEWVWEQNYARWPGMLARGEVDLANAFPPQSLALREQGIGHVILNTTTDEPWRHFFCCMLAGRSEFVRKYPVATRRVLRAFMKANQLCETDREGSARQLVEWGATDRYDYALQTLGEVPYGAWRDYDPTDTVRFYALRLMEAGLIRNGPNALIERGTDFRMITDLRQELKA